MSNSSETHLQSGLAASLPPRPVPDDEVNLLDYWLVIWKRRWLIGGLFSAAVLTALTVTLQMPKIYESTASLLPSLDSKDGGGLSSLLAASGGGAAQSLGISLPGAPATSTDIFVAMLKSRIMADAVIKQFGLMELYEAKTMQDAREALEGITKITVSKEKVIKFTVEDKNPQLAADVANFYVSNLDRLNRTLNVSKAGQNRAFIEGRLAETHVSLVKAEEALKDFQTHNKTVAVEAQSTAMIQAAAMIQAQISAQEVQLQVMNGYLSPDNPELSRVRSSIEELKKQLYLLEFGKGGKGMLPGDRLHPAMITVPGLALEYGRLLRELKVQEALYSLLTSQYEQAKLAEARDTPTVQVLDPAIPAEKKSKPSVRLNMMVAGALAFFVGIFLAFFLEYLERIRARQA
ncbi:MAG: LPS biosynthesis protein [Nitrospira sp.]|nr:MAG: LPS biosynthesis protein [Nitrospira sp.]